VVTSKKGQINPEKRQIAPKKAKCTTTPSKYPNALLKGSIYIFYTLKE